MFFDVSEGAIDRHMAGSTVVSNPAGIGCRLRGSGNSNSTPLNSKRASRAAAASGGGNDSTGSGSKASIAGPASGPLRPAKPCCFCWCCCCSCSCLAVKNLEESGPTKNSNNSDSVICDGEALPPIEEIRNWGISFDKLMKSAGGRKIFRDFLRCEYSEENILFWLACEDLKRETNPDVIEEKARKIYEDFISILSPKEVSLDSRVREIVNRNMVEPTPHTFDEAQLQIYTLMHRDSYPRFVNSSIFKNLAQLKGYGESEGESAPQSASQGSGGNGNGGAVSQAAGTASATGSAGSGKQTDDANG